MDWIQKEYTTAAETVAVALKKPLPSDGVRTADDFDPWDDIIKCVYGSYSSDFDECAIEILESLLEFTQKVSSGEWGPSFGKGRRTDLGAEMFREMLCRLGLCEYGTSPRVCFATPQFAALLPDLIAKWKAYSAVQWSED